MTASASAIDTPEKHYLEQELEDLVKGKEIWQFLREGSLDGIWYWDLEKPEHEWMSPEIWALLGMDPATKAHDPAEWQDLIHPDDLSTAIDNFEKHCADPNHPYDQVVRYFHADGSTVWVRCRGLAIRTPDGTPIRMLGAHNDVTAMKLAEEQALRERAAADRANEELQTFAYSTSHDLKSPANTIRMLIREIRLAIGDGDLEDADALLEKAEFTIDSMRCLVDELLKYTSLIGREDQMEPVALNDIIQNVLDVLEGDILTSGAKIEVDDCGIVIGSAWQLRQMFQNFVSNAIKFQSEGRKPHVTIRARPADNRRRIIEVEDNGIGIKLEDQKNIFDLFSKLHRPSSFEGSGIGLAYCHRVAKSHGSDIEVTSVPGEGSVFRVSLPV